MVDGQMAIRPIMRITLSVDHRVVDGAVAANFMADLRRCARITRSDVNVSVFIFAGAIDYLK